MIFKYKKLYDEHTMELDQYTLDMLLNGNIYFSKPSEFNDPYDFLLTLELNSQGIDKFCELNFDENESKNFKKLINSVCGSDVESIFANEFRDKYAVFCATNNHKNMLMWSHYADNHKGICIGIKTYYNANNGKDSLFVKSEQFKNINNRSNYTYYPLFPVEYSEIRAPKFDLAKYTTLGGAPEFMLAKSDVWSYEDEVRAVMLIENTDCQTVKLEENQIAEVFFGSQVPQEIKNKLIQELDGKNITFNEMRLSKSSYQLKTIETITELNSSSIKKLLRMKLY